MIDITQKRTVDKGNMVLRYGPVAVVLGIFVPFIGPLLAMSGLLSSMADANKTIKGMTNKEEADVLMLKTLEHYGLIRLLKNNQIEIVND